MEEQILAVQRMQDYIAAHLTEEITPVDLARASMFSPWYARRLFIAHTGYSPAEYIRLLRLSETARLLKSNACDVTNAAMRMGFGSVDGFTRAFARVFGVTPGTYRSSPMPIPLFIAYGVKFREMRKEVCPMENTRNIFIQVIEKPRRKVLILRGVKATHYFEYCDEVGCDVWGLLTSIPGMVGEPVCMWLPEQYKTPGTSTYVQGVEVDENYSGSIPEKFDVITLPASHYLLFQGEPFAEEDYCEAITAVQQAAKKYDPGLLGFAWDDTLPRIQLEPRGERGYMELYPIKERR